MSALRLECLRLALDYCVKEAWDRVETIARAMIALVDPPPADAADAAPARQKRRFLPETLEKMRETGRRRALERGQKPWEAPDDELLLALHDAGGRLADIASALGRTEGAVRSRLRGHGRVSQSGKRRGRPPRAAEPAIPAPPPVDLAAASPAATRRAESSPPVARLASAPPTPLAAEVTTTAPRVDAKRAAEEAAIAEFAARKGVSRVMSPEQVAVFLRDSGEDAVVREGAPGASPGTHAAPIWRQSFLLDGKEVTIAEFYRAANRLRVKAGLPSIVVPEELQAQGARR